MSGNPFTGLTVHLPCLRHCVPLVGGFKMLIWTKPGEGSRGEVSTNHHLIAQTLGATAGAGVSERPVLGRLFTGKGSKWQALALKCCLDSPFVNATFAEHEAQPSFSTAFILKKPKLLFHPIPKRKWVCLHH